MRDDMKQTYGKGDEPLRVMPKRGRPAAELRDALDLKVRLSQALIPCACIWAACGLLESA